MDLGPLEASDVAREITGSPTVNAMGYCIGGTLLTTDAGLAGGPGRQAGSTRPPSWSRCRISPRSATRRSSWASRPIDFIEQQMMERGYLDSREMSNMFNLLRSNDLIWANVVNNYLMGNKPPAFDLLYWNSDGTRMARAAHSWYLRNTYVENNLIEPGKITLKGEPIDLGRIKLDAYAVGAEKDHIVPWDAAWRITQLFGGDVRFVLASSGHIAGIINPPGGKGTYWIDEARRRRPPTPRSGCEARDAPRRQLVDRLVRLAGRAVRARRSSRRRSAARSIRRSRMRRAATSWRSNGHGITNNAGLAHKVLCSGPRGNHKSVMIIPHSGSLQTMRCYHRVAAQFVGDQSR